MSERYLAFDLGAESGRAMVGDVRAGVLELREIRRFANEPVTRDGSLSWDVLRLWDEMRQALTGIDAGLTGVGVDGWGVDFALIGEGGSLLENPYHYRDRRNDAEMRRLLSSTTPDVLYASTGIQIISLNTIFSLGAARDTAAFAEIGRAHV